MPRQLIVELVAEAARFRRELDDASSAANGFGEKMSAAGAKTSAFVSVPIIGFLGAATKAAMDDADAQEHLAQVLRNSGVATKGAAEDVEGYIGAAMKASTFTDDELRPAFEGLVRSSNNVQKSMDLLDMAMDIAASKGIPLETATLAVTKASEGQFAAVNKLVPGLVDLKDKTLTAEAVTLKLAQTFSGAAQNATETTAGKMKNMNRDLGELVEGLGASLLPVLTQVVDAVMPLVEWFGNLSAGTQKTIVMVALAVAAIGPLISIIGAVTAAITFLAASPIALLGVAVAAVAAGIFLVVKNWDKFKAAGAAAVEWVTDKVKGLVDWLGKIPEKIGSIASKIPGAGIAKNVVGGIGGLFRANGGPVSAGSAYIVGERGPEWFVPGSSGTVIPGGFGGGAGGGGGGTTVIQLMLDGQVVTEVVHDGLLTKQRQNRGAGLGFQLGAA